MRTAFRLELILLVVAFHTLAAGSDRFAFHRPAPQPGGSRLAFTLECHGKHEVALARPDGSDLRRLTDNQVEDWYPRWSPDGKQLVFFQGEKKDGEGRYDIVLHDLRSGEESILASTGHHEGDPAFTADRRIVFNSNRHGHHDIFIMNTDGSGVRRLTEQAGSDHSPAPHPAGPWMVYVSERDGRFELRRMNLDGSGDEPFDVGREENYRPSWSPAGDRLVFFGPTRLPAPTSGHQNYDVFRFDLAKSRLKRLTYLPSFEGDPIWSGKRVLFTSDQQGQSELFSMKADGAKQQALFRGEALERLRAACGSW
jgi:TolB protein